MADRVTGKRSPSLATLLAADSGPTYRQVDHWVRCGYLRPEVKEGERSSWTWPATEQRVAVAMARLVAAGLRPDAAEKVARHPNGGPVILAPGVIISLFPLRTQTADAIRAVAQ